MRTSPKLIIGSFAVGLAVVAVAIYSYFQSRDYLSGPSVEIVYPKTGAALYGPLVEIRGVAKRTSHLSLNGSQILIDPSGSFSEKLPLPSGYNIMKFEAKDRFGKQTERFLELMVTSTPKTD